jgi:hypothetical protein
MNELGGWLWAFLGIIGVGGLGFALAYGVNERRHRRKDFATRAEGPRHARGLPPGRLTQIVMPLANG